MEIVEWQKYLSLRDPDCLFVSWLVEFSNWTYNCWEYIACVSIRKGASQVMDWRFSHDKRDNDSWILNIRILWNYIVRSDCHWFKKLLISIFSFRIHYIRTTSVLLKVLNIKFLCLSHDIGCNGSGHPYDIKMKMNKDFLYSDMNESWK